MTFHIAFALVWRQTSKSGYEQLNTRQSHMGQSLAQTPPFRAEDSRPACKAYESAANSTVHSDTITFRNDRAFFLRFLTDVDAQLSCSTRSLHYCSGHGRRRLQCGFRNLDYRIVWCGFA